MKRSAAWFGAICLFVQFTCGVVSKSSAAETPNVIIFYADDQGYGDLSCYGSTRSKTPNIDRIASEGMRFTDFYSAYCVCSASRASLMTGSYQPRLSMPGVLGPHSKTALNPAEVTIADLLKTKGYATAMVGKWHLGDNPETLPTAQGFDRYFGLPYSNDMARHKDWGNNAPDLDRIWREKKWDVYDNQLYRNTEVIESPVNQVTLTDRYTDESIDFIRDSREGPFFLYLAYSMVHVPLFVSEDLYVSDPHEAFRLACEHVDSSVGQILKTLDELGLAQNTLVVYSSDNGPWLPKQHHAGSAGPLREGKATTYDGGQRVPCVMRWPGRIPSGSTCGRVASTIDILPTLAAITGASVPADRPIDGRDISPLLAEPQAKSPHDERGFLYYRNGQPEAIRKGNWKLRTVKGIELYNLADDIGESNNLAEQRPEVVQELQAAIAAYDADLKANVRPAWTSPDAAPKKQRKAAAGK